MGSHPGFHAVLKFLTDARSSSDREYDFMEKMVKIKDNENTMKTFWLLTKRLVIV